MPKNLRIQFKDTKNELMRLREFAGAVQLAAKDSADQNTVRVQVLRTGAWEHPWYGTMIITPNTLSDMLRNFTDNVRRQDLPIDYFHESDREAAGWVKQLSIEANGSELWADVAITPKAKQMLADKEIRYFSADFYFEWTDPETNVSYKNVLNGGGFVNRPFVKDMEPVTELSEGTNKMTLEEAKKKISELSEAVEAKDKALSTLGESVKAKDGEIATLKAEKAQMLADKEKAEKEASFAKLCSDGKACAAQKDAYMAGDMVKFAELAQPLNPAPKGSGGGNGSESTELSSDEKAACKLLGLSEADFIKYNKSK